MLISFDGLTGPVEFTECDEVADGIAAILRGWRLSEADPCAAPRPVVRLKKTRRGYRRVSPWLLKPSLCRNKIRSNAVQAVCGFHFEFIDWYLEEHASLLCLHSAAVLFDDGLVVFPCTQRSGKSTLTIYLAAAGRRVYCDDVLPIEPVENHGVALGILPRLRRPWPRNASASFRRFVKSRLGLHNDRYAYIDLNAEEFAPFGETAPIVGIVLLRRGAEPGLVPTPKEEILREVLSQNFALTPPALEIMDRFHAVVEGARCFTMGYTTGDQAVALLENAFKSQAGHRSADGPGEVTKERPDEKGLSYG